MQFRFIRLQDDPGQGDNGKFAGADINAVGAIGSIDSGFNAGNDTGNNSAPEPKANYVLDAVTFFLPGENQGAWGDTYPQRLTNGVDSETMGGGSLQLGDGGTVVALSSRGVVQNVSGADLVIYGEIKGPIQVDASMDGLKWQTVGTANSNNKSVDLGRMPEARFIRLVDTADGAFGSRVDAIGVVQIKPYKW